MTETRKTTDRRMGNRRKVTDRRTGTVRREPSDRRDEDRRIRSIPVAHDRRVPAMTAMDRRHTVTVFAIRQSVSRLSQIAKAHPLPPTEQQQLSRARAMMLRVDPDLRAVGEMIGELKTSAIGRLPEFQKVEELIERLGIIVEPPKPVRKKTAKRAKVSSKNASSTSRSTGAKKAAPRKRETATKKRARKKAPTDVAEP